MLMLALHKGSSDQRAGRMSLFADQPGKLEPIAALPASFEIVNSGAEFTPIFTPRKCEMLAVK
ncbi:hypothetical protein M3P05_20155 [Sansalvadorimonas sp. 2012CJ34-2]|uniref:Uncharacterized protein n=1 Tax=Parendozoicomonas callyspongiae TaxID=2942213 RepID=A0ABT0PKL7_9GAMM|nr:hypothetical protein [Sansalvadorimonas sp. 2012CJ34-2]MCL6271908.1 hypothetical protein [Sansalvadorimonas sp. 2012CJ34-2]MCL6272238.1 hypothetical protein [Sansalvadorimonas sp. 2012CJ34-2]